MSLSSTIPSIFAFLLAFLAISSAVHLPTFNRDIIDAPIYYGPITPFAPATGILTNDTTSYTSESIILCRIFMAPAEDGLKACMPSGILPRGIIHSAPLNLGPIVYLGSTMYHVAGPAPAVLIGIPIVEVFAEDFTTLCDLSVASNVTATIDSNSANEWIDLNTSAWSVWWQVSISSAAAVIIGICVVKQIQIYKADGFRLSVQQMALLGVVGSAALRGGFCAIDPANMRRIITDNELQPIVNLVLALTITVSLVICFYWHEMLSGSSLNVTIFLESKLTKSIFYFNILGWCIMIIIQAFIGFLGGLALAESAGLLRYGLIIYLIIAYGLATIMYWITGIRLLWAVFFTTQSKGKRSRMLFIVAYILGSGVGLLLIVICIITTITPVWGIPYGQSVSYWFAYVGHSITQLFQSASFNATKVGKSGKTASGSRERATSAGVKTSISMPNRSSSAGNTTSLSSSSSSSSSSEESPDELA